jgi:hypothetical protein
MSNTKEVVLTGEAAAAMTGGKRRGRTRKQRGGDNSGGLMQLAAQSTTGLSVPKGDNGATVMSMVQDAMKQLGPDAIQRGGDNSGALMQLTASQPRNGMRGGDNSGALMQLTASQPRGGQRGGDNSGGLLQLAAQSINMGGPLNSQNLQNQFRAQVATVLNNPNNFGPDRIQQLGGKKQKGGDLTSGVIQLRSSEAPTMPGAPAPTGVIDGVKPEQPAPVGGARLVLAPPKRKTRIALKAKKMRGGSESVQDAGEADIAASKPLFGGAHHTRKARKIQMRVRGVTSRLAKAKKARKTAMNAPISDVRSRLEKAGVIKRGSKAPEPMLRNMYADLLITKKGL